MSQRILITGCSGFLANHLVQELLRGGEVELLGLTEVEGFSHPGMAVACRDLRDQAGIRDAVRQFCPDLTFHLGAITNVAVSWADPSVTYAVNLIGSSNLLEALEAEVPNRPLVLMSTAELYRPAAGGELLSEEHPLLPQNPYALSKLAMEMAGQLFQQKGTVGVTVVRSFNFTGPGQARLFVASDFAAQIAEIEAGRRDAVIRVGNLAAVRDFSDVRDIARFLALIGRRARGGEMINLCSGQGVAAQHLLDVLLGLSGQSIRVEVDPGKFRPLDVPRIIGDPGKLRREFGLNAEFSLGQTLADLLDWWRARTLREGG